MMMQGVLESLKSCILMSAIKLSKMTKVTRQALETVQKMFVTKTTCMDNFT